MCRFEIYALPTICCSGDGDRLTFGQSDRIDSMSSLSIDPVLIFFSKQMKTSRSSSFLTSSRQSVVFRANLLIDLPMRSIFCLRSRNHRSNSGRFSFLCRCLRHNKDLQTPFRVCINVGSKFLFVYPLTICSSVGCHTAIGCNSELGLFSQIDCILSYFSYLFQFLTSLVSVTCYRQNQVIATVLGHNLS